MNLTYINLVAPHHDKHSCTGHDESAMNARYKADDFGGCYRCTLLRAAAPDEGSSTGNSLTYDLPALIEEGKKNASELENVFVSQTDPSPPHYGMLYTSGLLRKLLRIVALFQSQNTWIEPGPDDASMPPDEEPVLVKLPPVRKGQEPRLAVAMFKRPSKREPRAWYEPIGDEEVTPLEWKRI